MTRFHYFLKCNRVRCNIKQYSTNVNASTVGLAEKPSFEGIQNDYIGPPDKDSNIRPYVRHIPQGETIWASELRLKRIQIEEWNQDFWSKHNKRYYKERDDFVKAHKIADMEDLSADKMSIFYKQFLDKNRKLHLLYNISWYMKNFDLLCLASIVNMQTFLKKIKK